MLRSWPSAVAAILIVIVAVIVLIPVIRTQREMLHKTDCLNHFRSLGQFAALYAQANGKPDATIPQVIPPGTIVGSAVEATDRLSWVAGMLPFLDKTYDDGQALYAALNVAQPWSAVQNLGVAKHRLRLLLIPGAPKRPEPGQPEFTQIVGLTGLGPDSPLLPRNAGEISPRAGCFRYDSATPLSLIRDGDGTANTLLFGETSNANGPWLQGGPSTVRWLDTAPGALPMLGSGGQFGGHFTSVTGFAKADGSAGFHRNTMTPAVLRALFTIRGRGEDVLPGGE